MKIVRLSLILSIVLATILLSGCFELDIEAGIDENFTSYLTYNIKLDASKLDERYQSTLRRALNEIGWIYQEEHGFNVHFDAESTPYYLSMTKRVANNGLEQAFESLERLLTNEDITPFMSIDMAFDGSDRQYRYILGGMIDIPQIMRLSNAEELSPEIQEHLENAISAGTGTVIFKLPASEVMSSTHTVDKINNIATLTAPISFTNQSLLELSATVNLHQDGTIAGTISEILRDRQSLRNMIIFICGVILVVLLIIMIIINLVKKKAQPPMQPPSESQSDDRDYFDVT